MALPLLNYAPKSQNQRVAGYEIGGDEQPRVFTTENVLSSGRHGKFDLGWISPDLQRTPNPQEQPPNVFGIATKVRPDYGAGFHSRFGDFGSFLGAELPN